MLGGAVDTGLINELHHQTRGNPLMLRGLLSAGRESGVLVRSERGWQLRGALRADRQLCDLLEFRLRSLAAEELEAMEVVAVAEVLDWEILRGLCDADAVGRLERSGVIQLVPDESHTVARLAHPILGEVVMQRAGVVRSRQLNGMLAQNLRKQMWAGGERSRPPDVRAQIQLAQFMMRSNFIARPRPDHQCGGERDGHVEPRSRQGAGPIRIRSRWWPAGSRGPLLTR